MGRFADKAKQIKQSSYFEPLELNEGNIQVIFNRCLAKSNCREETTYAQVLQKGLTGKVSDEIWFMRNAISENYQIILYLFGQLKSVHENDSHIPLEYGVLTYNDRKWTTNMEILFKLYELGIASATILPFSSQKINNDLLLTRLKGIKPTLSPKDPNFPAWWEAHKSEWETEQ